MPRMIVQYQLAGDGMPTAEEVKVRDQLKVRLLPIGTIMNVYSGMGVVDITMDVPDLEASHAAILALVRDMNIHEDVVVEKLT